MRPMSPDPRNRARNRLLPLVGVLFLCCSALAQQEPPSEKTAQFLPPGIGEPFTIVPTDLPDVDCAVLQWNEHSSDAPILTLLCPPSQIFAPLRVLVKLTWRDEEQAPVDSEKLLIAPGEKTRLRTRKDRALIQLTVLDNKGRPRKTWVSFTGVADVALLPKLPKRRR